VKGEWNLVQGERCGKEKHPQERKWQQEDLLPRRETGTTPRREGGRGTRQVGRIEATLPSGAPTSVGAPDGFLKRKPRWQSRVSNDETRAVVMAQAFYIQPETLLPAGV